MDALSVWWSGLASLNQWFYVAAAFFTVFFLWQVVMAIVGMGGVADLDTHVEPQWEHQTPGDAGDTLLTFKLLSVRSVLAFFTLFTWAGALYMNLHVPVARSLSYAVCWGLAAMGLVSLVFHGMRRMTESGNLNIASCVGKDATVYLDIPAGGDGEARVLCGTALTHFKARAAGGKAVKAGTAVRVVRALGPTTLEVETMNESQKERDA